MTFDKDMKFEPTLGFLQMLCDRLSTIEMNQETILDYLRHEHISRSEGRLDARLLQVEPNNIELELQPEFREGVHGVSPSLVDGKLKSVIVSLLCSTCVLDDEKLYRLAFPAKANELIVADSVPGKESTHCVTHGIVSEMRYAFEEASLRICKQTLNRDIFSDVDVSQDWTTVTNLTEEEKLNHDPTESSTICIHADKRLSLVIFIREAIRLFEGLGHSRKCTYALRIRPVLWEAIQASRLARLASNTLDADDKDRLIEAYHKSLLGFSEDLQMSTLTYLHAAETHLIDPDVLYGDQFVAVGYQ